MTQVLDLSPFLSPVGSTLKEVMTRIDRNSNAFQLIVDDEERLIGTVTDGDIRRGLLRGVALEDRIDLVMKRDFVAERVDRLPGEQVINRQVTFIPVLDSEGRVATVLLAPARKFIRHALVMAGGFGRRLGTRTANLPKPLVTVGDRPILDRIIEQLENAGVQRITLSLHYLGDKIRDFIADRPNQTMIDFVEEKTPLGTAGALSLLTPSSDDPMLVVNGDLLTECNFNALNEYHRRQQFDGTIAIKRYEIDVPYGLIRYDENGLFSGIDEKPRISNYIAAGIYYLGPKFFGLLKPNEPIDMPDLLYRGRAAGLRIGLFPIHEYWLDIGQPKDLLKADQDAGA